MKHTHMKKKSLFSTILSLLIAVIMLLTLPGFSTLADSATDSTSSGTTDESADADAVVGASLDSNYIYLNTAGMDGGWASTMVTHYINVLGWGTPQAMTYDTDLGLWKVQTQSSWTNQLEFTLSDSWSAIHANSFYHTTYNADRNASQAGGYVYFLSGVTTTDDSNDITGYQCYSVNSTNVDTTLTLSDSAISIYTGDTETLTATTSASVDSSYISWTSSSATTATVSAGAVTGVAAGTATITAVYGAVSATCTVTVNEKPTVEITPESGSVKVGSVYDFTVTLKPSTLNADVVTWTSSNKSIASVVSASNGTFRGEKAGTVTVTASITVDGTTYDDTATLTVTEDTGVDSITLSPSSASLQIGDTYQLTAAVSPAVSSSVIWSSNNPSVATVDQNGLVTAVAEGSATITATAAKDSTVTASAKITVSASKTLYYLVPASYGYSGVWVHFYKDNSHKYNTSPDAGMTKLDASDYLVDGKAISGCDLYSITVPSANADYAIFTPNKNVWTGQDPANDQGGYDTTPAGKNGYYKGGMTCLVTQSAPTEIDVTPDTNTISTAQTAQLKATATYKSGATADISATDVTWTSSDTSIATVDSAGLVTPVAQGEVTITATSTQDASVSGSAKVTVKNADPTSMTLSPSTVSLFAGTTTTLMPSYEPDNVNPQTVNLVWTSSNTSVATVDEDGVVTAVADGTATITATVRGTDVKAASEVTVSANGTRIYYYAALSKLDYSGSASGANNIPATGSVVIYAWVWNNTPTDGRQITLSSLGKVSGNGITYADGDIYYADNVVGTYSHIVFANGSALSSTNLGFGYGQGTAQLTIPDSSVANPCFYAGSGDDSVYSSETAQRPGYWASLFTVFDPEKVSSRNVVYVNNSGTKPETDSHKDNAKITYVSSTLYDYYSDYELNGKEKSTDWNLEKMNTQRNWVTFREFDQALSDSYKGTEQTAWSTLAPIYTGHFQPDELKDVKFSAIEKTLGLFGYSESYYKFMATENSNLDINGEGGKYGAASQGLVASDLAGFQNGSLGTGTLLTNDGHTSLPHFNRQFLEGQNSKNAILGSVYENVAFPFTQEKDPYYKDVSYYTFDSARESVYYRTDSATGEGYLEDVGTDAKSMNVNSNSATSDISTTYGYFPFNEDSISKNAKTYDYGFGTKLEFQFSLKDNGDVTSSCQNATDGKAPTIFKFSGDDDVWVYIDGKLVLDLGGSHGQVQGAINFSNDLDGVAQYPSKVKGRTISANVGKNSIWVSETKASAGTASSYDLSSLNLQDGKTHTLTLYYMERGMWESNMMIQFNMEIQKTLTVKKDWKNYDGTDLADSKKTTVYAMVTRKTAGGTETPVNLTDSGANDGTQYLIKLDSSNTWTQTFNVAEYNGPESDANKYTYYVYEVKVDSSGKPIITDGVPACYANGQKMTLNNTTYQVSGTGEVTGSVGTITNTRQKGSGVTITKAWSGTTSEEMKPKNVYVVLYEKKPDGKEALVTKNEGGKSIGNDNGVIILNSKNNWTESVEDLKASSSYIFKEVTDSSGTEEVESGSKIYLTGTNGKPYQYTVSGGAVENGSATITNTFNPPKTSVSITKSWVDESGNAVTDDLPDTIYVKLKRTGTVNKKTVTQYWKNDGKFTDNESDADAIQLDKNDSWTKTISDLDVYADIGNQTHWTYSLYGESTESENESGHLIRINAAQYVVDYGSSYKTDDKGGNGTLTVTNKKLPQTAVTVQKIWKNMDGKTSDEITKEHSETIRVYLKRFTKDSSEEKHVGYYKVSDGVISFTEDIKDATAIELTSKNSYQTKVNGLDQYFAAVGDTGTVTTPYYFELVSESGSWDGAAGADATAGTGGAADESSPATESGGKITLNGKTYLVQYGNAVKAENSTVTVTVTNTYSPAFTLPVTGGRGRNILLGILGGAAVLAAVLYWNIRKTRRRKFGKE